MWFICPSSTCTSLVRDRNRFITHMFLSFLWATLFGCLSADRHGGPYFFFFLVNFASCCVRLADFGGNLLSQLSALKWRVGTWAHQKVVASSPPPPSSGCRRISVIMNGQLFFLVSCCINVAWPLRVNSVFLWLKKSVLFFFLRVAAQAPCS